MNAIAAKLYKSPINPAVSHCLFGMFRLCVLQNFLTGTFFFFFFWVVERGGAKMNTPASLNLKILFQEHCLHMHRGNHPCGHAHVNFILFFIYFIFALWAPESNKNKLIYWYIKFWKWV